MNERIFYNGDDDSWYFWDESESKVSGPFSSRHLAEAAMFRADRLGPKADHDSGMAYDE